MEVIGFILSATLLACTTRLISNRFARSRANRFFLAVAAAIGQIGVLSLGLSFLHAFAPGPFLLSQTGLLAIVLLRGTRRPRLLPAERSSLFRDIRDALSSSRLHLLLAVVLGFFIVSTAIEQWMLPVFDFDDRMYHASRAAYWVQHQSILAYVTQNDRQIAFPLTGELMFGWALMLLRYEPMARFVFWLAYPLSGVGVWFAIRELTRGQSALASTAGMLLFGATPIVLYHTQTVHPDLWLTLFCTGVAYFTARLFADAEQ